MEATAGLGILFGYFLAEALFTICGYNLMMISFGLVFFILAFCTRRFFPNYLDLYTNLMLTDFADQRVDREEVTIWKLLR